MRKTIFVVAVGLGACLRGPMLGAEEAASASAPAGQPASDAVAGEPSVLDEIRELREENRRLAERLSAVEARPTGGADQAVVAPGGPPMGQEGPVPGWMYIGKDLTFKLTGDVRLRNEDLRNAFDLSDDIEDDWNSTRLRTRVGFDLDYKDLIGGYIQLTNEYRWGSDTKYAANFQAEDIRVDNAYIRIKRPWDVPLTLTAGRQDLLAEPERGWRGMYGEGWILFDGTPQDGSATISFDSAKLRWDVTDRIKADFIYIKFSDLNLAPPGPPGTLGSLYSDSDWDEDAVGLYTISQLDPFESLPLQLDAYCLYRDKDIARNFGSVPTGPFVDPKVETAALGGRLATRKPLLDGHLMAAAEGAYQTGTMRAGDVGGTGFIGQDPYPLGEDIDRDAFAWYAWTRMSFDEEVPSLKPYFELRFDYFSGDDPDSQDKFEGWDSFYGEWPKYSELLIYTFYDAFATAHGEADPNLGAWANMYFPSVEIGCYPIESLKKTLALKARWRYFMASNNKTAPGGTGDRDIGHLAQGYIEWAPYSCLRTHAYFDYFFPGDYYSSNADDAWFLRFEVMLLF